MLPCGLEREPEALESGVFDQDAENEAARHGAEHVTQGPTFLCAAIHERKEVQVGILAPDQRGARKLEGSACG